MQVEPRPQHFPRRNRIIAGLSLGVVMVEAAAHSGALITAREASQEGREVMAVPGRLDSPASAGCLRAIREGWAALVTGHVDILQQLDAASHLVCGALERAGDSGPVRAESLFDAALSPGQQVIVDALRRAGRALRLEEVAAATGLPVAPLMAELTLLQVRGLVERDREGIRPRR
jgi:DNA processing protein